MRYKPNALHNFVTLACSNEHTVLNNEVEGYQGSGQHSEDEPRQAAAM